MTNFHIIKGHTKMYALFCEQSIFIDKDKKGAPMENRTKRVYRLTLCTVIICACMAIILCIYKDYYNTLPRTIVIQAGQTQEISYHVPVSGYIRDSADDSADDSDAVDDKYTEKNENQNNLYLSLDKTVMVTANRVHEYEFDAKLYGFIPFKQVSIQVVEERELIPMGTPIGIYVETKGILVVGVGDVVGEDGVTYAPARYTLQKGDYIVQVNGEIMDDKYEFVQKITASEGKEQILTI